VYLASSVTSRAVIESEAMATPIETRQAPAEE
jgi:hypothetical protein